MKLNQINTLQEWVSQQLNTEIKNFNFIWLQLLNDVRVLQPIYVPSV